MNKRMIYRCDYCDKEFANEADCMEHEETHTTHYDSCSNEELSEMLKVLSSRARVYHMFGKIADMPLHSFENLMNEAARRIADKEDD